jgi:hypothetical protein
MTGLRTSLGCYGNGGKKIGEIGGGKEMGHVKGESKLC